MMTQSYGWNLQRLQHSQNNKEITIVYSSNDEPSFSFNLATFPHRRFAGGICSPGVLDFTSSTAAYTSHSTFTSKYVIKYTHIQTFNGPFFRTTKVSRYQKGKTNLDFTEARDSGISWAICKSAPRYRQTTMPAPPPLSFLQAGCPSCCPTNSVKALKA